MGLYSREVVPRLISVASGSRVLAPWRARTCEGLAGRVVEIGFGAGHNLPFYPPAVREILAVEPSDVAWRLAARRVRAAPMVVTRTGVVGESVPLDDGSCDAALITFTLCTVSDPGRVLAEVRRLLRPGGELHVLEHGRAPDPGVARWQARLDPLEQRLVDGCHLTRDVRDMLATAGFELIWSESAFARGPQPWTYLTAGVARPRR